MSTKEKSQSQPVKSKRGGRRSTSWKPGQSGNPKGAPRRGTSWKERFAEFAENETPPELRKFGNTYGEALVATVFRNAIAGNARMAQHVFERSERDQSPVSLDSATADEEFRGNVRTKYSKLLEAARDDPERTQKLLALEAQRLEIERQISSLSETPRETHDESPTNTPASD